MPNRVEKAGWLGVRNVTQKQTPTQTHTDTHRYTQTRTHTDAHTSSLSSSHDLGGYGGSRLGRLLSNFQQFPLDMATSLLLVSQGRRREGMIQSRLAWPLRKNWNDTEKIGMAPLGKNWNDTSRLRWVRIGTIQADSDGKE